MHMREEARQWLSDNAISVIDAVVDAIITIDQQGSIQSANQSTFRMFGYTEEELVGQNVSILMPEPYQGNHQGYVERFIATGEATIIGIGRELPALRKDGSLFPIYLAISEIPVGDELYFTGIIRDLSAQKEQERALADQREHLARAGRLSTMGEMTASIAHEINQPLTAIAMYAQACLKMLDRAPLDRAKLAMALDKLNTQSLRAGSVIERIQRFVRNESGERELVRMDDLLGELQHLAAGDARSHGIDISYEFAQELPEVFCDPVQIQQVALNLLRNAIDSMQEVDCVNGNQIRVTAVSEADAVCVEVSDQGTGVPEDQQELVFGAFHSTKRDGMGMGLSICESIMEAHGGDLDFRNNAGVGATFYFRLPTTRDPE